MRRAALLALTFGCSSAGISVPADRLLPSWTGAAAEDQPFPLHGRVRVGWKAP